MRISARIICEGRTHVLVTLLSFVAVSAASPSAVGSWSERTVCAQYTKSVWFCQLSRIFRRTPFSLSVTFAETS